MKIRHAPYALRVVRRAQGDAAILYRRQLTQKNEERLERVASISALAFTSGSALIRTAVRQSSPSGAVARLVPGPFLALDTDWGARVGCYALVCRGLRNAGRMAKTADQLRNAESTEAAWWFGHMTGSNSLRAVRALRILLEAVK